MIDPSDWIAQQFVAWRDDPERFVREFLDWNPWKKQVEVLEALRDHDRVAVPSGHSVGKSAVAGAACWWWKLCHEPSKVIVTAPGGRQAEKVLGGEVRARFDALARRFTPVEMQALGLGTAPTADGWRRDAENFILWFATARDQGAEHATRATGWHSPHLLCVFEEAGGVSKQIRDAMDGCLADDGAKEFAIGNPSDPTSWFAAMCRDSSVCVVRIDAEQFPNVIEGRKVLPFGPSRKWIEQMRRKWGEGSGSYAWKVRGLFPTAAADSLISYSDVLGAFERSAVPCPHTPGDVFIGIDPARFGDDESVIYGIGRCGRILKIERRHGIDVVAVAGLGIATATALGLGPQDARQIAVDGGGLGAGVVDRMRETGWKVREENFASSPLIADETKLHNRRAELWFQMRDWLRTNAALTDLGGDDRDRLLDQLTAPKYFHRGDGSVLLESKDDLKKRIGRSPDDGDALALAIGALMATRPHGPPPGPMRPPNEYDERDVIDEAAARGEPWALDEQVWSGVQVGRRSNRGPHVQDW